MSARLLALVNEQIEGTKLRLSDITWSAPVSITPENGRNTEVIITGRNDQGYLNQHRLVYRRLDLSTVAPVARMEVTIPSGSHVTTDAIVDSLNANYGLDLDYGDVEHADNLGSGIYRLKAAMAYRWIGEVDIYIRRIITDVAPSLTITTLGEFNL